MPREYEVSRDGKRLLLIKPVGVKREPIRELQVLTGVFSLLETPSRVHP